VAGPPRLWDTSGDPPGDDVGKGPTALPGGRPRGSPLPGRCGQDTLPSQPGLARGPKAGAGGRGCPCHPAHPRVAADPCARPGRTRVTPPCRRIRPQHSARTRTAAVPAGVLPTGEGFAPGLGSRASAGRHEDPPSPGHTNLPAAPSPQPPGLPFRDTGPGGSPDVPHPPGDTHDCLGIPSLLTPALPATGAEPWQTSPTRPQTPSARVPLCPQRVSASGRPFPSSSRPRPRRSRPRGRLRSPHAAPITLPR